MNKHNNPTIEELQNSKNYELFAELHHDGIKEFVIEQVAKGGTIIRIFMIYQISMIVLGSAIFTYSIILAFNQNYNPLFWCSGTLLFCFSFLVVIHELIHGAAIKLTGAPKVNFGAYFRKFIFYAEADKHVLNRKQFTWIALAPFLVIKFLTLVGIVFLFKHPSVFGFVFLMCAHSLFCAGDIGLLSVFYHNPEIEVFTFDNREERKSYYYQRSDS